MKTFQGAELAQGAENRAKQLDRVNDKFRVRRPVSGPFLVKFVGNDHNVGAAKGDTESETGP